MQGSRAVNGVGFEAETTLTHSALERSQKGDGKWFAKLPLRCHLSEPSSQMWSTVCSWAQGKIGPCVEGNLLKGKENGIVVIFRHQHKLHEGFYLEIAYRFLLRKLSLFFLFSSPLSLFLELSLVLRKTGTIQPRGDGGGGLAKVDSKCSLA